MTTKNIYFISALIFLLGFIVGGIAFSDWHILPVGQGGGGQIACPKDVKLCPGGLAVGRVGPNCKFAECPSVPDRSPLPICLSSDSKISTPTGDMFVKDMKPGMSVWTTDKNGKAAKGVVLLAGKTPSPLWHRVVHLQLADGRELFVSPGHRVADGRRAGDIKAGNTLEGIFVASANLIPYTGQYTYDILPSGDTGMYFANGILLRSTLK